MGTYRCLDGGAIYIREYGSVDATAMPRQVFDYKYGSIESCGRTYLRHSLNKCTVVGNQHFPSENILSNTLVNTALLSADVVCVQFSMEKNPS